VSDETTEHAFDKGQAVIRLALNALANVTKSARNFNLAICLIKDLYESG
jgi:hypothetical protein